MKQIIYSTGVFETTLTIQPPEEEPQRGYPCYMRIAQPQYELRKTSPCLMRYEIEAGDYEQMQILRDKADKASIQLRDGFISIKECQMIVKRYQRFENIYNKAQRNDIELYKDMYYIEMADETCQGCSAMYRFSDEVCQQEIPHKIGEPLVIKVNP